MTTMTTTRPARIETFKALNHLAARYWRACPSDTAAALPWLREKLRRRAAASGRALTQAGFDQLLRLIGERQAAARVNFKGWLSA